ncbi:hypothetical protein AVW25_12575 [Salmonella enterica]|nr:hypothetical protein [Salmonella enterica]
MNTYSGDGAESWHFPPEYAFTQNQNQRSRSARMTGHVRPEYAVICITVLLVGTFDVVLNNIGEPREGSLGTIIRNE